MSEPKILENKHNTKFKTRLESLLSMQYGEVLKDSDTRWRIEIADKIFVKIDLETLTVDCEEDTSVADLIEESVKRLYISIMPITKLPVLSNLKDKNIEKSDNKMNE